MILAGCCVHYFALGRQDERADPGRGWDVIGLDLRGVGDRGLRERGDWGKVVRGDKMGSRGGPSSAELSDCSFSLPGIIIGPIRRGFSVRDVFREERRSERRGNSTFGSLVGGLAGMIVRVALALMMIACYVLDTFVWN